MFFRNISSLHLKTWNKSNGELLAKIESLRESFGEYPGYKRKPELDHESFEEYKNESGECPGYKHLDITRSEELIIPCRKGGDTINQWKSRTNAIAIEWRKYPVLKSNNLEIERDQLEEITRVKIKQSGNRARLIGGNKK